ncbi:hypothetical protein MRB53_031955 [Persea americana]|uniref:Uncharacterized protein n=1 Tax=Persea americana TaxID=3435 RepID=A0ACC2KQF4_PERAE|nr:hypothetical protein MRB53_031955 [Persea americana]|eukprot:TRINITY_DN13677_c0_g3_i1.p1 TRINITY_DN13677_c0_g3~~TRINITY_DN13677_c0_g3_i1.p1  ORF type:complete len:117 (-),score=23.06 TRINITY_DN13677_c0_g3_i1:182-532(-)
MEKRQNTGEIGKPEEHVGDEWGKERGTGNYQEEEGDAARDVGVTQREDHCRSKGKEGDGHKQGNDLHLPLSDSYSFIPLFHHGLEESHRCKEDLKTVEAERFATGSDLLGFIPLLI